MKSMIIDVYLLAIVRSVSTTRWVITFPRLDFITIHFFRENSNDQVIKKEKNL